MACNAEAISSPCSGLRGAARFAGADWMTLVTGAPLLRDALACMDCRVEEVLERHTHAIVIGRVTRVAARGKGCALVYWRGGYDQLGWGADELARAIGVTPKGAG